MSSCISRSRRSTSGLRGADCSQGVGGAQAGGPAVGALRAGYCSREEVTFGTEVTGGADRDTGGFLKESGWPPGATAAAWGAGAVVGAESSAGPANATQQYARLRSLSRGRSVCAGGARGPEGCREGRLRAWGGEDEGRKVVVRRVERLEEEGGRAGEAGMQTGWRGRRKEMEWRGPNRGSSEAGAGGGEEGGEG